MLQYKFFLKNNDFIEPTAGFTYTKTQSAGAESLGLEDGHLVRLQTGVGSARVDGTIFNFDPRFCFLHMAMCDSFDKYGSSTPSDVGPRQT